jgi:FlaG/FlaF family flagellin (archaellin)
VNLHRLPRGVALVAAAALTVIVVALFAWIRGSGGESSPTAQEERPQARADVTPRRVLFGDTVTASVEVTLDRDRVDPDSVQVGADFRPWKQIASPERIRRDNGSTTSLRMTYVLRCLTSTCIATDQAAVQTENIVQTFGQARVTYTPPQGTRPGDQVSVRVPWPRFLVDARYSQRDAQNAGTSTGGWRADLLSMPTVTYSVTPGLLFALLLAGGVLLTIAAGAFAHRARLLRPLPAPLSVTASPGPVLTPLELALALLEDSTRVDGAADQRRALELVAAALAQRGDLTLAHASRALAWSKPVPGVPETNGMAVRARAALGQGVA